MELSKEQRAFVKRIMDAVPDNVCYNLNIVRISGKGWSAIAPSGHFIEDPPSFAGLECLEEFQRMNPGNPCWSVHSESFEFGNPDVGSDPVPENILALIKEFGWNAFAAAPELRRIDSASFEFNIQDAMSDGSMTPDKPLKREHIVIDRELLIEDDGINAYIETWFDVDGKFSVNTPDNCDSYVNFYATYNPDDDSLKCTYVVVSDGGDKESEYIPLPEEVELIKTMMNEVSLRENGCDLTELWKQREE